MSARRTPDFVLSVKNLSVSFGRGENRNRAVQNLSYELEAGETLAIVGESGSGKSVSSLALLGLLPPSTSTVETGQAWFDGGNLLGMSESEITDLRGDRITMIFQEPMTSLNPVLTIGRQLTEGLIVHKGMSMREAEARSIEMIDRVRIPNAASRLRQYPHELSGGMRQRIMIAMAMASDPAVLIADEPTTALDVTVQAQILDLMRDLKRDFGTSIILITHDMGVVAEMADRVVVMHRGQKVEEGAVGAVFDAPRENYTKALLAAVPKLGSLATTTEPPMVIDHPKTPERETTLVKARNLTKRFRNGGWFSKGEGVLAMDDVGFDLAPSETLAIVGESGSGKSTTGRAVLRLIEVDTGEIKVDGRNIRQLPKSSLRGTRRTMQMIFQDPFASLNPRMSAGRLVMEPMAIHGIASGSELVDRAVELLRRVGLEADHMRRYPHEFSGGQRQRICIARALGPGPKLIVADEPTSALDVSVQAQVLELMLELQQSLGLAYLFISHDMAVVEQMSHRVAVMHKGRIVEMGPRQTVLNDPRHAYTKTLLAAVPVPDPTRQRGVLPTLDVNAMPNGPLTEVAADHWVAA
ncbi:MAG: ABC transporter ATP-binding protein [Pseudomonadota bacterium]